MNDMPFHPRSSTFRLLAMTTLAVALLSGAAQAAAGPARVNLGEAGTYVILTKTGITNVPTSDITGNLGTSPIDSTAITGFSLILDGTGRFSRSSQVTGKIFAADYVGPTPSRLTTAVGDMETAYTDAAGRSLPDHTELYGGDLSGRTLAPGLYKWSSGVLITADMTLAGPADAVWIFQIAKNLTVGSGAKVLLSGGAQSRNIFWQVGGGVAVEIGTTAHVEGTILTKKAIHLRTGASLNGRALAQTAVTLDGNAIVIPPVSRTMTFTSGPVLDGFVLESAEASGEGGSKNSSATTARIGDDGSDRQYRAILHFDTSALPDTAVITRATLRIQRQEVVGMNPFGALGLLRADVGDPDFGPTAALTLVDFQAAAGAPAVATFGATPVDGWHSATVNAAGRAFIDVGGATQFRLRFAAGDNDNMAADFMRFYTGDAIAANRPRLIIRYYVPNVL